MTSTRALPIAAALMCLSAAPAYACGPTRGEAILIASVVLPIFALLVSPLVVFGMDIVRMPFGLRLARRGAIVRAILGAGGAAVGFWGGLFNEGKAQLVLLAYGAACATLLAYSAAAVYGRKAE